MIKGYVAVVDQDKLGLPVSVFASIKLERQREEELDRFAAAVMRWPEVADCYPDDRPARLSAADHRQRSRRL